MDASGARPPSLDLWHLSTVVALTTIAAARLKLESEGL